MTRFVIFAIASLALAVGPSSAAEKWGIDHEKVVRFEAKVVDILCLLTGNCPADCGAGRRQLGLLRDDGRLLLVAKNRDIFAGASNDLIEFCNKRIIADGLLIESPKMPLFALQFLRLAPDGKWSGATRFQRDWAKRHGTKWDGKKAKNWYRNDERIKAIIEKDGVFGIPGLKPKAE